MVPDTGQGQWVHDLQEQGADTTDEHAGEIAMHLPADGMWPEQAGVALGALQVKLAQ
ncbi:hypothetical protein D3C75_1050400 [compost metagenome]